MDIKDFILIGGGLLIAVVVGHGFWIAWRARRDPLRIDLVRNVPGEAGDELHRLRAELPNGGARVVGPDEEPEQGDLGLDEVFRKEPPRRSAKTEPSLGAAVRAPGPEPEREPQERAPMPAEPSVNNPPSPSARRPPRVGDDREDQKDQKDQKDREVRADGVGAAADAGSERTRAPTAEAPEQSAAHRADARGGVAEVILTESPGGLTERPGGLTERPGGAVRESRRQQTRESAAERSSVSADNATGAAPRPVAAADRFGERHTAKEGAGDSRSSNRNAARGRAGGRGGIKGPAEPKKTEVPVEELIMINVLAPKGAPFTGPGMVEALRARGLRYGDMNIFHRQDPMTRATLYSVANVVEPGIFDMADLDSFRSPGVCFFMQLPGPERPIDAFEDMLKIARDVAVRVGGDLKDEQRSVMTGQTVEHYRQRISDFCRRRMSKRA